MRQVVASLLVGEAEGAVEVGEDWICAVPNVCPYVKCPLATSFEVETYRETPVLDERSLHSKAVQQRRTYEGVWRVDCLRCAVM